MKKIGIVGLGIMGRGMAANSLKNKYKVFVWNRTKATAKSLVSKGAIFCDSPKAVAANADIVFEITANDKSSKSVWNGKNGILTGATSKKILIVSATLSIAWTDELIKQCKKLKFNLLDIPLTGGRIGAETGNLTMLCGGQEKTLKKIKPVLKAIASKILYFGPEGHGMRFKLILNFLQAIHLIGFGQAMKIARASKMNMKKVGEALADRPGGVITSLAWRDYHVEPDPINFSIEWITKDLTYAKQFASNLNVSLLNNALSEYKRAMKKGFKDKDWASINTLLQDS